MHVLDTVLAALQLIAIGLPIWFALRPRNWGSYPLWVSTLEHFSSLDPWSGVALADWNLELFLVVNNVSGLQGMRVRVDRDRSTNQPPGPGKRRLRMREALALRHGPNDAPRFLPRALANLWLDGACPADRLPWLLRDMEPRLKKSDFQFAGVLMRTASYLSGIYGILFAVLLGVYIFVVPPKSHRFRDVERDVFISEPQREQAVFIIRDRLILIHDPVPWPSGMVRVPAGIRVTDKRPYEIGWYKASSGRRLLAIPMPERNDPVHGVSTRPFGTVWRTGRIGLLPEFLQQLKARTPDLDVSYITVDGWWWADQNAGGALGDGWLWVSLVAGIPAFGLFVLILTLRGREHKLQRGLTQRLAGVYRTGVTA